MAWNGDFKDKNYILKKLESKQFEINSIRQKGRSCGGSVQSTVVIHSQGCTAATLAHILCVMFSKEIAVLSTGSLKVIWSCTGLFYLKRVMYYIQNSHKC